MSHELDEPEPGGTPGDDSLVVIEEDRTECELIDGKWVGRDPEVVPGERDHKGYELIDGK